MPSFPGSAPPGPRPARRLALSLALIAFAALLLLGGCDIQRSFLKIPEGGYWERLTPPADSIAFFPDWRGQQIVYSTVVRQTFRIATIRMDGTARTVFPGGGGWNDFTPRWVNDTVAIFSSNRSGVYHLWYLNVRSGAAWRLASVSGSACSPAPRPGGPGLAFTETATPVLNGRVLFLADTAAVAPDIHYLSPDSLKAGEPDWDPSGSRVCFSAEGSDTTRHIWLAVLGPTDTTLTQLTTGPYRDLSPRFSPDGTRIVFTSGRGGASTMWIVNPAGETAGLSRITTDDPGATTDTPAWSPDGFALLVASDARPLWPGHPGLWFVRNLGF